MALLEREDDDGIAKLTMAAPERLNALSDGMLAALTQEFGTIATDDSIRAVILSGEGRAFCAGHDLKEMQAGRQSADGGAAYFKDLFDRCATMMMAIRRMPQPVIAQAHGIATAAGCQLVASCDMAVAAEGTRFGVNGVNIGLFCSTPMVALTRNIPTKQAFEMLTTGRFIESDEAVRLGLINRAVPMDNLEAATLELARSVASKLPGAVRIGKSLFYDQGEVDLGAAYEMAGAAMVENMLMRDTDEGIDAFLSKRKPDWAPKDT